MGMKHLKKVLDGVLSVDLAALLHQTWTGLLFPVAFDYGLRKTWLSCRWIQVSSWILPPVTSWHGWRQQTSWSGMRFPS